MTQSPMFVSENSNWMPSHSGKNKIMRNNSLAKDLDIGQSHFTFCKCI